MQDPPRGTVTFLFTDIEGNTRLGRLDRDALNDDIRRHLAILTAVTERHNGYFIKRHGDGAQFAFGKASHAVAAAVEAQIALTQERWTVSEPFRVRMVLDMCEVDPEWNGHSWDYNDPRLNRLGRMLEAGHGGQILMTPSVYDVIQDDPPDNTTTLSLGEHRLRDLDPERIFQVAHPDLPVDFLPLETTARFTHNLPYLPTSLIGRERETAEVRTLLLEEGVRLVTLTGPGGTGKTRLAIHVAAGLLEDFKDGVFLVDLASLQDAELVPSAIARALGVREEPERPVSESLQEWLRERHLLLVLDTFEQVIKAAEFVAQLLSDCPHLEVLVASRAALDLQGEYLYLVPPLAVPDAGAPTDVIVESEAVRLFVERARSLKHDFSVSAAIAPTIALICARLEGLPLAIELAAARIKIFPPATLLGRLERRLSLLTGGARNLPARQRALRDTIAWSYDLLDDAEQALFRRLSVFVGGFTFDAAEAVCGSDILDGIVAVINNSLLRQEDRDGEPRYLMLDTLREFGWDQLEATEELETVQNRHAEYFLDLAERMEPLLRGAERTRGLESLDHERDNIRAALAWLRDQCDAERGLRLASALWQWWWWRTSLVEGRRWLEEMLALPATVACKTHSARALTGLATLVETQGDYDGAEERFEQAAGLWQELGDRHGLATSYLFRWLVAFDHEELARMEALAQDSLDTFAELNNSWGIALSQAELGITAMRAGALDVAGDKLGQSLANFRDVKDRWGIAIAVGTLANVRFLQASQAAEQGAMEKFAILFAEGKMKINESLDLFHQMRDGWGLATFIHSPARAAAALGRAKERNRDTEGAHWEWERSLKLMGFGSKLCDEIGAPLRVPFRGVVKTNKEDAEKYLGSDEYHRIWAEGEAMSRERAVACARNLGTPDL